MTSAACTNCGGSGWYIQCLVEGRISPNQLMACEECNKNAKRPMPGTEASTETVMTSVVTEVSAVCPNCSSLLEGRSCKLICPNKQCGYRVTCSE